MTNEPPALRRIIDMAWSKHAATSFRDLERRSEDLGVHISHTTLSAMHKGQYASEISKDMRTRLATLAGVRLSSLDGITGMDPGAPFVLPDSADSLTADQRAAILSVVRAFASANRRAYADADENEGLATVSKINNTKAKRQTPSKRFDPQRSAAEQHLLPPEVVEGDDNQDDGGIT